MNKVPHVLVVALAAAAPVFFQMMAREPLSWTTLVKALVAAGVAAVGVLLPSPLKGAS